MVKAEMHPCCVEALSAGTGCCGKDSAALQKSYEAKVDEAKMESAAEVVKTADQSQS